ncbi:nucleotidyltransferase family protein [Paenibacillus sp. N3/727]|uniref:nucleotidyltransferase domain-containing protein n=1 Tax=Paenibacillus sp. N3/727 TaxID=2925845 RepID=UPI001F52FDAF|nr:nucleotidyltransferase family protein [Paenibacillus sp. N3/727]UNK18774.1 nucleotidyltransferase family protein [Paenibacillus sp. N3/727]
MILENTIELDLSDVSKELSFLLFILRDDSQDEMIIQQHTEDLDWKLFMRLVLHHRVYPLVYLKLKGLSTSLIPANVMESLHLQYHNNTMKMLHLSREMSHICEAFTSSGIRNLLLKGPILATQLYGDLAHRTSKDLDILVDADDVEKAEKILVQLGYKLEDEHTLGNWKKKSHHLSFEHIENCTQVEIHWRLNPHFSKSFSFDQLWERKHDVILSNQTFHYLGNEDLLYYLADHGARHGWFRLRWLIDIERLLPRINSENMKIYFDQYGGQQYVGQAFILLSLLFSTKIPHDLECLTISSKSHRLAGKALYYIKRIVKLNPVPEKSVAWHYNRYLFSLMSGKQKLAYLLNKFHPSSRDALLLPLPKSLHFLYFPLRPFLWLCRYLKRESVLKG